MCNPLQHLIVLAGVLCDISPPSDVIDQLIKWRFYHGQWESEVIQ